MQDTTIVQFNCGHSNGQASRPLFDSMEQAIVIAVQEPRYNRLTRSTYCPRPYELAYEAQPETRVCFMIRRDVGPSRWRRRQYGPNVAALQLNLQTGPLTIVNVYNPRKDGPRIQEWTRIAQALEEAQGEIILLGDFNAHHSEWGGLGTACEHAADHLLVETRRRDLGLLTPRGEPTWTRGNQRTVIDLTFATPALCQRVSFCGTEERWALTQDHIPIRLTLDLISAAPPVQQDRFALGKLDLVGLQADLATTEWQAADCPLSALQAALQNFLPRRCPPARPCPRARPDWSPRAAALLTGARQARRRYAASRQEHDHVAMASLSNQLKQEVKRVARSNWRALINGLSTDQRSPRNSGLWRLSKWSRRHAGQRHKDPHLPALRRTQADTLTHDDTEKAAILAARFFPGVLIDSNQQDPQTPTGPQTPAAYRHEAAPDQRIPIMQSVTEVEALQVLNHLPCGRAPGPDRIPNEILKALGPFIAKGVALGINKILAKGEFPASFRESTTITLRKEGKKDYTLPGSYRPIALENTLAKIVEKVLATRLSDAAETFGLLPWTQMGARRQRSTASALGLLTNCIQSAWQAKPGCVVSMLSLDLTGAFDNVPSDRLNHALTRKGIPQWFVNLAMSFTRERRTKVVFPGFVSDWITTREGIPQGSPLSPILFLFFI